MNAPPTTHLSLQDLLKHYEHGLDVTFPTHPHAAYERRLIFDHVVEPPGSTLRQRYEAIAGAFRCCPLSGMSGVARTWIYNSPAACASAVCCCQAC